MNKTIQFLFISIVLFLSGCLQKVDSELFASQQRVVIDGLITNEAGPYFVRVAKSSTRIGDFKFDPTQNLGYHRKVDGNLVYEPIKDAVVTIEDDMGNVDVLELWDEPSRWPEVVATWADLGMYRTTTQMRGVAGHTYTLTVVYEGQKYESVVTIPPLSTSIDEVKFEPVNFSGTDTPTGAYIPFVSFQEPQNSKDYYMFFYRDNPPPSLQNPRPEKFWTMLFGEYLIFDDKFLVENTQSLSLQPNNHSLELPYVADFSTINTITVEMHSISAEAFDYYQALNEQIKNDGGAYSAAPASPPTNISNGALGFFRASSINRIEKDIKP